MENDKFWSIFTITVFVLIVTLLVIMTTVQTKTFNLMVKENQAFEQQLNQ